MPGLLVTASSDDTLKFWDILVSGLTHDMMVTFDLSRMTNRLSCSAKMFIKSVINARVYTLVLCDLLLIFCVLI